MHGFEKKNLKVNMKVIRRGRKRHTAHCVSIAHSATLSRGRGYILFCPYREGGTPFSHDRGVNPIQS